MRILLCTDRYLPAVSGVVTSVVTLQHRLEAAGHEVRILTLSDDFSSSREGAVTRLGSYGAGAVYPEVRIKHPTARLHLDELIAWHPDIIHCNTEFSTFWYAKRIYHAIGCPMVMTYHTDYEDYVHYLNLTPRIGRLVIKAYIRHVSKYMSAIICPSVKTARRLSSYGVKAPVHIIPTGLDLERFKRRPSNEELASIMARHKIRADHTRLVFIGRLGKEKKIDELIRLLSKRKEEDFQLIIVGDGPDKSSLEELAAGSPLAGRVIFTGMVPQDQVPAYYHIADVFLSASTSETQGLTYMEAMAAGRVLLCREDPCLDGVIDDGHNGFTYSDDEAFQERLDHILGHREEWKDISARAVERVDQRFGAHVFAASVIRLYNDAVRTKLPYKPLGPALFYHWTRAHLPWI